MGQLKGIEGGRRKKVHGDESATGPLPAALVDTLSTLLTELVLKDLREYPDLSVDAPPLPADDRAIMRAVNVTPLHPTSRA
jgi:hypothetical protein